MQYQKNKMSKLIKGLLITGSVVFSANCMINPVFAQNNNKMQEEKSLSDSAINKMSKNGNTKVVDLKDLMSNTISGNNSLAKEISEVSIMRRNGIIEIAGSLGMSAGLMKRMSEYKAELEQESGALDNLYNFSFVKIDNGVLPPVLTEGLANYAQNNDDEVRIADIMYKIEAKAKFVSVYPTWRNYLVFNLVPFDSPENAYLPKTPGENAIWDEWVKKGWEQGVRQANEIFESSYNRLKRDYKGMLTYKNLAAQGLITKPVIAKANLGVTGGGNEMSINDQIFRISDHSALNPNQKEWKTEMPVTYDNKLYENK